MSVRKKNIKCRENIHAMGIKGMGINSISYRKNSLDKTFLGKKLKKNVNYATRVKLTDFQ